MMMAAVYMPGDARASFDPTEDERLVERIVRGDRKAEELFYRRHVQAVAGTVRRLVGHRSDAEEIVQETFLSVFDKISSLREPRAARAWVLRVAVSKVSRRVRKQKVARFFGIKSGADDELSLVELASPDLSPEARVELAMFEAVLRRLPASERIAWMLRYIEGEQLEQIGEICECSLATVKRRIAAADEFIEKHIRKNAGVR